jgi:hypothetical protein
MANLRDPSTFYDLFGRVAHGTHYSKADPIERNSTSEKLISEGIYLRGAYLGDTIIQGKIINMWCLSKRSI